METEVSYEEFASELCISCYAFLEVVYSLNPLIKTSTTMKRFEKQLFQFKEKLNHYI